MGLVSYYAAELVDIHIFIDTDDVQLWVKSEHYRWLSPLSRNYNKLKNEINLLQEVASHWSFLNDDSLGDKRPQNDDLIPKWSAPSVFITLPVFQLYDVMTY